MALGAIAALKEAGKLAGIKVGGFDGSPDAVAAIKAGELQYTVLQPVAIFSAKAVQQADQFIKTGATGASSEKQLFDCLLITKDNVDKYTALRVSDEDAGVPPDISPSGTDSPSSFIQALRMKDVLIRIGGTSMIKSIAFVVRAALDIRR
jgi:hypothetical protein